MKTIIILITAILISFLTFSQDKISGTVVYENTVKLEIKLEGEASQFADMLPKERKSEKILYFTSGESLYENYVSKASEDAVMHLGSINVMIKMVESENKVYTDVIGNG